MNANVQKIELGDFEIFEKGDNLLTSKIFGIPIIGVFIFGILVYLVKK